MSTDRVLPLCVDREGLALMLLVSPRTIRRMDDSGKLPEPLMLLGCKRWYVEEIHAWLRAGAPPRKQWNTMQDATQ
jgi:hypothetical protein